MGFRSASLHLVKDNKLNFQEFLNVAEYKVILSAMDYLDDSVSTYSFSSLARFK
jgi:hypothetical protein